MYVSIHIPKTAGTAFRRHLEAVFGNDLCYDYMTQYALTDYYRQTIKQRIWRLARAVRLSYRLKTRLEPTDRCIHGHFQADKYRYQFPDGKLITWLRDPVERVASHYYHWQRNHDLSHTIGRLVASGELSLGEFSALEPMRNLQYRYLLGTDLDDYFFVGIQERFDELMPFLFNLFDMPFQHQVIQNTNPAKAKDSVYAIDECEREIIKSNNLLDIRIYEQAVRIISNYELKL